MKFYKSAEGNRIFEALSCCGSQERCSADASCTIVPIKAGEVDASEEKHVPVASVDGKCVTVRVGEVEHPMTEEHYIEWILIKTTTGTQRKCLKPNDKPCAEFALVDGESFVCAYAYCNLHSLWKA
mgnify:CR=1 FL=1